MTNEVINKHVDICAEVQPHNNETAYWRIILNCWSKIRRVREGVNTLRACMDRRCEMRWVKVVNKMRPKIGFMCDITEDKGGLNGSMGGRLFKDEGRES